VIEQAELGISGDWNLQVIKGVHRPTIRQLVARAMPRRGLSDEVNDWRAHNVKHFLPGLIDSVVAKLTDAPTLIGSASHVVTRGDGTVEDLGLASLRVVTTAGVNAIASHLNNNGATISAFKFIGWGSGATAPAIGDTALVTEFTTEYVTNSTRPTGTQSNSSANVYQCVSTFSPDSGSPAVTECGVFSASAAGTLLDRFTFSVINLVANADSLQTTFQLTLTAGS